MTTRVVNRRTHAFDIYIGRPSKWGNIYTFKEGTLAKFIVPRDEVLSRYEAWLKQQPPLMAALPELKDKILGCWCNDVRTCHGSVLARLADNLPEAGPQALQLSLCWPKERK